MPSFESSKRRNGNNTSVRVHALLVNYTLKSSSSNTENTVLTRELQVQGEIKFVTSLRRRRAQAIPPRSRAPLWTLKRSVSPAVDVREGIPRPFCRRFRARESRCWPGDRISAIPISVVFTACALFSLMSLGLDTSAVELGQPQSASCSLDTRIRG